MKLEPIYLLIWEKSNDINPEYPSTSRYILGAYRSEGLAYLAKEKFKDQIHHNDRLKIETVVLQ